MKKGQSIKRFLVCVLVVGMSVTVGHTEERSYGFDSAKWEIQLRDWTGKSVKEVLQIIRDGTWQERQFLFSGQVAGDRDSGKWLPPVAWPDPLRQVLLDRWVQDATLCQQWSLELQKAGRAKDDEGYVRFSQLLGQWRGEEGAYLTQLVQRVGVLKDLPETVWDDMAQIRSGFPIFEQPKAKVLAYLKDRATSKNVGIRSIALGALAKMVNRHLDAAYEDTAPPPATHWLTEEEKKEVRPLFIKALQDKSDETRLCAVTGLGGYSDDGAKTLLQGIAKNDQDSYVREWAQAMLNYLNP